MAYSFELLGKDGSPVHIRDTVQKAMLAAPQGWPCWSISNHDVERVISRWGNSESPRHLATQLTAVLCSLRGAVCVYQGEELGLTEAEVPFELLQDPYGIAFWPNFKGRDGCRTPMPWNDTATAGFTDGRPWLPIAPEHRYLAASIQELDERSPLHAFRRFLRWRKGHPALIAGDIDFIVASDTLLAFRRRLNDECLIAAFNFSATEATHSLPEFAGLRPLDGHGLPAGRLEGSRLVLPPHGVFFAVPAA
jgi:alpha-glucosidase